MVGYWWRNRKIVLVYGWIYNFVVEVNYNNEWVVVEIVVKNCDVVLELFIVKVYWEEFVNNVISNVIVIDVL